MRSNRSDRISARALRFARREDGAATVLSLFWLMICLMLVAVTVDSANAWRAREHLKLTADVAAHAGAAALARGGSGETAVSVAAGATELNAPTARYGRVIADPFTDVVALHYDYASNTVSPDGPPNAVTVRVQRSAATANPVPTLLLRMAGRASWDVAAESVAAVVPTRRCAAGAGIYAAGRLTLIGGNGVGAGFCLHGQEGVGLEARNVFARGSGLSMPDLALCDGRCADELNPGVEAASAEVNLLRESLSERILRLGEGFADPAVTLPEETDFFATRPLSADLSALEELDIDTEGLEAGSVLDFAPSDFLRLREIPAGLVYRVDCGAEGEELLELRGPAPAEAEAAEALAETPPGEAPPPVPADAEAGPGRFRDAVLVTDCALHFGPGAEVQGALALSLREGPGPVLTADPAALAGDPDRACAAPLASTLMALGGVLIPSEFAVSNVAIAAAGDIGVEAPAIPAPLEHAGMSLHSGGQVQIAGDHSFAPCPGGTSALLPELRVIRHVLPRALAMAGG